MSELPSSFRMVLWVYIDAVHSMRGIDLRSLIQVHCGINLADGGRFVYRAGKLASANQYCNMASMAAQNCG